ncbi:MAG: RecQ family ATP-dependent DNA helicase [Cyclobacteriaceae bacterium]|nr:RecQ family ATP-dependent DNA helicase [Cyclobacteriaceae bacterium]
MPSPLEILKQYWRYDAFRPMQGEIIDMVLSRNDVIALLPTGGGKSICFQVPALVMNGLCLVISPLIALMKDQVDQLNKQGIKAYAIYTGITNREIDIILDNCIYGQVKLLYVSPERLQTELFRERAKKMEINLLAVDEAHCISQWGYDFRPMYLQIAAFRNEILPQVHTIALTATATESVICDIAEKLELKSPAKFKASFARQNLAFAVRSVEQKEDKLLEILARVPGSALVYTRSRRRTQEIASLLLRHRISADYYHAGLGYELRMKKQDAWKKGQTRTIVATNAFGMGINKENVRVVVHYDVPDNLEAYYQEAGRAGRDGKRAYAVVLYHPGDKLRLQAHFQQAHPSIAFLQRIYQALANYFKLAVGSNLLSYFDFDITDFCNNFNLGYSEVYYAIKKLEEEGLLELTESFYHPSRITVNVDKAELYKFQIANATLDPLIKILLRLYGGEILGNFIRISENQIARMLNTTSLVVKKQLEHLNALKVITYDKMRDKPQLAFVTPRYDAAKLPLNRQRLAERSDIQRAKTEAMIQYAEQMEKCRTAMILDYFDEVVFNDCGHCDYCIEKKRKISKSDHIRIKEMVQYALQKGPEYPEEIGKLFSHFELPILDETILDMVNKNILYYDDQGRLCKRNNQGL